MTNSVSEPVLDVVVVGSGFSGLGMAIQLARAKRTFVVLEKGHTVGGTWRENRYPGCACDVQSHLYSFSFALNPDWSQHYATQPEILAYLEKCADDFDVRRHCRFGVEVSRCTWDEATHTWLVEAKDGQRFRGRHLALGLGGLHYPRFPDVKGRESFQGPQLHSAAWDSSVDLRGKKVVVVGTGASAIQVVPALASVVDQLTVFQRTPAWVMPRRNARIWDFTKRLFRLAPVLMQLRRLRIYLRNESYVVGFIRAPWVLKAAEWLATRHLRRQLGTPALQAALTPSYAAGCKRILVSDDYYPAFNRPNVALETCAVAEVTKTGVVTPDGRHVPCDAIVWCTGFDLIASDKRPAVVGREGRTLDASWSGRLHAFRGTTVPGFPNLYTLMGPNTGLGHNSMVFIIESQIRYVLSHLDAMEREGATAIEVKPDVEASFNQRLDERTRGTIWVSGCTSWYLDAKGQNGFLWPGSTLEFRRLTRAVPLEAMTLRKLPA